jgi:F0F1-type ATP synthase delta subunit
MNKEQQKKLLIEIMDADAKDGLYETVTNVLKTVTNNHRLTAVEWLVQQFPIRMQNYIQRDVDIAKQMEKEQIEKAIDDALNAYGIIKENNK